MNASILNTFDTSFQAILSNIARCKGITESNFPNRTVIDEFWRFDVDDHEYPSYFQGYAPWTGQ